jgi:hypothetical protein
MSNLLEKLKQTQKIVEKEYRKNLNPESNFSVLTDDEIALVLAYRAKELRISLNQKQKDFAKSAKLSASSTYSNFEQKGTISLINFIKVMRSFGRLYELDTLLKPTLLDKIDSIKKPKKRRVKNISIL